MNSLRNQRWCLSRWLGVEFLSIFLCCIVSLPGEIEAHPLGNFSLNHYTAIELQPGELITRHVLDFAEIPSFNELANLDTDRNDFVTPEEISVYRNVIAERFIDNATYSLGEGTGTTVLLQPKLLHAEIVLSQGQGALTCLQIQLSCAVQHPILTTEGNKRFFFQDHNDPHINGVREIRIKADPGVEIQADGIVSRETPVPVSLKEGTFILTGLEASLDFSIVEKREPPTERTLPDIFSLIDPRSIPVFPLKPDAEGNIKILKSPIRPNLEVQKEIAMLQPRTVISATGILSGNNSSATQTLSSTQNPSDPIASRSSAQDSEWASLIGQEELSPGIVFLAILVSIVAGASHALSPGHGKTVVAAYLVGSRGTVWHAIYLGLIVTMTHVSSVLLLGILILSFSQYVVPEKLYPWIEALSGLIIVIMGMTLFFQRYGAFQRKRIMKSMGIFEDHIHPHSHSHSHHPHSHSHGEENEYEVPSDQDEFHSHEESDEDDHPHSHQYPHPHPHSHIHEGSTEFHAHHHEEDFSDHPHSDHDSDEDPGHSHSHSHSHDHDHDHDHDHEFSHSHSGHAHDHEHGPHTHTHEIPANASWWDLLILGVTGGMLPCPAAILVLLGAVALHRILFGMVLILFFSVGLATVLIGIGILMVTAKNILNRIMKGEESFAWLQILSPILVTILGIIIFVQGLRTGGIITFHF